ncbi:15-cis-phytoene synthase [Burkholderiales bacterium]|nr:15-cis-phytoene synthase [Burkholderiales bacterium]
MSVGHYENFPVASFLVPARERRAVVAIYRFARAADDLADEGDDPPEARLEALARFRRAVDAIAAGVDDPLVREPPFAELARAVREHALPTAPLADLLSAFAQDVTVLRYADFAALADYCRRSADPVGRLLLALYRRDSAANLPASDAICTGLQLANFCQDVAIDHAKGRVYLPQDELARHRVTERQIADGRVDDAWRALMLEQTARARALLLRGRPLASRLPWRLGLELSAIVAGGLAILDRVDAVGGDVFRARPVLSGLDWARVGWRALVPHAGAA